MGSRRLKKGDKVEWVGPKGRATGTVLKVVTKDTRVRGTRLRGSEEDPVYIVRSLPAAERAHQKEVALRHRP